MHADNSLRALAARRAEAKTPAAEIVLINNMHRRRALALTACALLSSACARKKKKPPVAVAPLPGAVEQGIASWYGHPYHGRRTASGEIYDMEKLTAAHRTLPFDTWVEVTNLANGRKVRVRITDRGPFVEGRIIDLSRAAARQIQMIGPGVVKVRLEVIAPPRDLAGRTSYAVQVGAFRERDNAERLARSLERRYGPCRLVRRENTEASWRVLVGKHGSREEAEDLARELRAKVGAAFVVRVDDAGGAGI